MRFVLFRSAFSLVRDAYVVCVLCVFFFVPSAITLGVVEEAGKLGVTRLWLQPGSESAEVLSRAEELGLDIIHGEPCVLVELGYYAPGGLGSGL